MRGMKRSSNPGMPSVKRNTAMSMPSSSPRPPPERRWSTGWTQFERLGGGTASVRHHTHTPHTAHACVLAWAPGVRARTSLRTAGYVPTRQWACSATLVLVRVQVMLLLLLLMVVVVPPVDARRTAASEACRWLAALAARSCRRAALPGQ